MAATAKQMVEIILTAIQTHPVGVISISIDGQSVTYSQADAREALTFWEKRAARESGRRPVVSSIRLDQF